MDRWNWIDCTVVVIGATGIAVELASGSERSGTWGGASLQALRDYPSLDLGAVLKVRAVLEIHRASRIDDCTRGLCSAET